MLRQQRCPSDHLLHRTVFRTLNRAHGTGDGVGRAGRTRSWVFSNSEPKPEISRHNHRKKVFRVVNPLFHGWPARTVIPAVVSSPGPRKGDSDLDWSAAHLYLVSSALLRQQLCNPFVRFVYYGSMQVYGKVVGDILASGARMRRQDPVSKMPVFRTRRAVESAKPLRDDEMIGSE